jgi:hypothetical protein
MNVWVTMTTIIVVVIGTDVKVVIVVDGKKMYEKCDFDTCVVKNHRRSGTMGEKNNEDTIAKEV